jgi:hypothetical protein
MRIPNHTKPSFPMSQPSLSLTAQAKQVFLVGVLSTGCLWSLFHCILFTTFCLNQSRLVWKVVFLFLWLLGTNLPMGNPQWPGTRLENIRKGGGGGLAALCATPWERNIPLCG